MGLVLVLILALVVGSPLVELTMHLFVRRAGVTEPLHGAAGQVGRCAGAAGQRGPRRDGAVNVHHGHGREVVGIGPRRRREGCVAGEGQLRVGPLALEEHLVPEGNGDGMDDRLINRLTWLNQEIDWGLHEQQVDLAVMSTIGKMRGG